MNGRAVLRGSVLGLFGNRIPRFRVSAGDNSRFTTITTAQSGGGVRV